MIVRVAQVQARSAPRPPDLALDGDPGAGQVRAPPVEVLWRDREGEVLYPGRTMRGDAPARCGQRLRRRAPLEQEQHAVPPDVERDEPRRLEQHAGAEPVTVEGAAAGQVGDVERGLDDAGDRWPGHDRDRKSVVEGKSVDLGG